MPERWGSPPALALLLGHLLSPSPAALLPSVSASPKISSSGVGGVALGGTHGHSPANHGVGRSAAATCQRGSGCGGPSAHCRLLGCSDLLAEHLQPVGEASMEVMLLETGESDPVQLLLAASFQAAPFMLKLSFSFQPLWHLVTASDWAGVGACWEVLVL